MAQVSYGTITITDTTDIERIYPIYCKGDLTNAPSISGATNWNKWKELISQAGGSGNYIWQRIVTKKAGVEITYSNASQYCSDAVRLTGEAGTSPNPLTITSTQYAQTANENDTPSYGNTMPSSITEGYWLWVKVNYSDGNSVVTKIKQGEKGEQGISVTGTRELYWLKINTNPPQINWNSSPPGPSTTIYSTNVTDKWTSITPTYVTNGIYYTCVETSWSDATKSWSAPISNEAITSALSGASTANAIASGLQSQLKYIWVNSDNQSYDYGTYAASGIENTTLNFSRSNTYGFNSFLEHNKIHFRYNAIDLNTLGIDGLKLYTPVVNSNNIITNAYIGAELTSSGLKLYSPTVSNGTISGSQLGMELTSSAITIGNEANNLFNIKITDQAVSNRGPGILLRKGSQVLNEITADGMSLYDDNDILLLKISGSQLDYAKITNTSNVLSIRRNDDSKYYITSPPSVIYGAYATDLDFYTIDKTIELSYMSSLTNGSKFILFVPLYCNSTTTPGWYYNQTLTRIYTKGTAYNDNTAASVNGATLSISYDGNMTFTFTLTNNENTSLGYGPAINYYPISIGPSYGHIGNYQSIAGHLLKGNDSFSFNLGTAQGQYSFAINMGQAFGYLSFAAGQSHAIGSGSVALGKDNVTFGRYGFVSGERCQVFKNYGIAMGLNLRTISEYQTIFGKYNQEDSEAMFVIGNGTADDARSNLMVVGDNSIRIGNEEQVHINMSSNKFTISNTDNSFFELSAYAVPQVGSMATYQTNSSETAIFVNSNPIAQLISVTRDNVTQIEGVDFIRDGNLITFSQEVSSEVQISITYRLYGESSRIYASLGVPNKQYTAGVFSTTEGSLCAATGKYSHAEGEGSLASGKDAHAEGLGSTASGNSSHAEGHSAASGIASHSEGGYFLNVYGGNTAAGESSHAEGFHTRALGDLSHSQNLETIANCRAQTTMGSYNISDYPTDKTTHPSGTIYYGKSALIIGNGTDESHRSNAFTVDWNGGIQMYLDSNGTSSSAATSGTDMNLFNAIYTLGWYNDVIE